MKNIFIGFFFTILFVTCTDDNVTIVKQPGELTGTVLPLGINAKVYLTKGDLELVTSVKSDGNFVLSDIDPGVYTFQAKAESYGSNKKENIKIEDNEGYEIGNIELDTIPYPINTIGYQNYGSNSNMRYITIEFKKFMDISSLTNSINIFPVVSNMRIETNSTFNNYFYRYYVYGDYNTTTEYTITIDTSAQTYWGEKLEFPYSVKLNSKKRFEVTGMDTSGIDYPQTSISVYFNQDVNSNISEYIDIKPNIALDIDVNGTYVYIRPVNSWFPDTTFILTISKNLKATNGDSLDKETVIKLKTPSFKIRESFPQNGQILLESPYEFRFYPNFLIDSESFMNQDCITIEPDVEFTKHLYNSYYHSTMEVSPDTLQSNTEYTITINTKLKDYWGNNLKEPYTVTFKMN